LGELGTVTCLKFGPLQWIWCSIPIFVAVTKCKDKVRELFHDSLSCGIHDIQPIFVVWLDELIFRRKSGRMSSAMAACWYNSRGVGLGAAMSVHATGNGYLHLPERDSVKERAMVGLLREATAVYSHYNPSIGQQSIRLLEQAHVFIPEAC
jgi:hypothetical protein